MNSHPELLAATPLLTDPARRRDRRALSELSVTLLTSGKPSRFAEAQQVMTVATCRNGGRRW